VEAAPAVFLGIAIHEAVTLYSTNGELVDAYKDVEAKCN
jgi:hypothetical protein